MRWLSLRLPLLAACGCGTIHNLHSREMAPYGGVTAEAEYIAHGQGLVEDMVGRPLAVLDFPLTIVGDTLTLPVTLPPAVIQTAGKIDQWWERRARERFVANPSVPEQREPLVAE